MTRPARRGPRRLLVLGLFTAAAAVLGVIAFARPPQMGASEDVFKAVDALYTAVTARDEQLLGRCERSLRAANEAGRLPDRAWDYLAGVIGKARAGDWEPAAKRLYDFMLAQRREVAGDERAKAHKPPAVNGGRPAASPPRIRPARRPVWRSS